MTPLPGSLGGTDLVAWRLDDARFASTWDSGEGAYRFGGRWNSPGTRVVYAALDPSTAILEVAVHTGFAELAARPHVLTSCHIANPALVRVMTPGDVPDEVWLRPSAQTAAQQRFGDTLMAANPLVVLPSTVSRHSWNILIAVPAAAGEYARLTQEPLDLDPRLHSP